MKYSRLQLSTTLRELTCHGITQCYLPIDRGDVPALIPAKASILDLATPEGCKAELTLDLARRCRQRRCYRTRPPPSPGGLGVVKWS